MHQWRQQIACFPLVVVPSTIAHRFLFAKKCICLPQQRYRADFLTLTRRLLCGRLGASDLMPRNAESATPMSHVFHTALALLLLATPAIAQTCNVDMAAVEREIARLETSYGFMLSDIGCDAPTIPAHRIMCDATETPDAPLWRMGRLDDLAWVYAYENATGTQVDLANPPRDPGFIAQRDTCTDVACLCDALIAHTNGSLGGLSPYPQ
jgi:hypothetical protein